MSGQRLRMQTPPHMPRRTELSHVSKKSEAGGTPLKSASHYSTPLYRERCLTDYEQSLGTPYLTPHGTFQSTPHYEEAQQSDGAFIVKTYEEEPMHPKVLKFENLAGEQTPRDDCKQPREEFYATPYEKPLLAHQRIQNGLREEQMPQDEKSGHAKRSGAKVAHAEDHGGGGEEKIYVTVRVRPMSEKEILAKDDSVWRVTDQQTLHYMEPVPERSPYPASYHFDRVFGPDCSSQKVYLEGARDVVLSALTGLNASIFAYGMTSSGKTYTMKGVMDYAVLDMFEHIQNTPQREYMIRVSALEIYNEIVRDLLNPDSGALRLLDDPDRGTVVEKLKEEVVRSSLHLRQILAECESQRQVGETQLNDASSRSHQIVRLTVESCPRAPSGLKTSLDGLNGQVLMASLNFVDLAGSERASQTHSEGTRLKEGGHINRSLLTLGTVIRKLSGGNKTRVGHIPYRDSKLTRILQHSLGGNGRTAIICTMSPARTHVDQTRNTLSFAIRAKEVTNTAHINLMVSDKVVVKQLQREVARLEAELRTAPSTADLEAEHLLVHQLELEVVELARQRDEALGQVQELRKALSKAEAKTPKTPKDARQPSPVQRFMRKSSFRRGSKGSSGQSQDSPHSSSSPGGPEASSSGRVGPSESWLLGEGARGRRRHRRAVTRSSVALVGEIRKLELMQDQLGEDATRAMEALTKEIECLRLAQAGMNHEAAETIAQLQEEVKTIQAVRSGRQSPPMSPSTRQEQTGATPSPGGSHGKAEVSMSTLRQEISWLGSQQHDKAGSAIAVLEEKLESMQQSLDNFCGPGGPLDTSGGVVGGRSPLREGGAGRRPLTPVALPPLQIPSNGGNGMPLPSPPKSPKGSGPLGKDPNEENVVLGEELEPPGGPAEMDAELGGGGKEQHLKRTAFVDMRRMQMLFKSAAEENIKSIRNYVTELKERVAKLHHQKQLLMHQVLEMEESQKRDNFEEEEEQSDGGSRRTPGDSLLAWPLQFEREMTAIVELWHLCLVPLVHRTQFYLLINGDPADSIYLEVEHRRLAWLWEQCQEEADEEPLAMAGSVKALRLERELIAKRMKTRLTAEERETLFAQWAIPTSAKKRKLQLAFRLWNDPTDMRQVEASAHLIGHIMGFPVDGGGTTRELFALQFAPPSNHKKWLSKKLGINLL